MELIQTIAYITEIIKCFNEGLDFISRFNEHYEKWTNKKQSTKSPSVSIDCEVINIKSKQKLPKPNYIADNILVYMSDNLYNIDNYRNKVAQNIKVKCFSDNKALKEFSSVMLEHQKESIIVIRSEYKNMLTTLQLDMLNIVPGNDDICYRISYRAKSDIGENNYKNIAADLLEGVVVEIIKTYQKYQQTIRKSRERLELEARILNQLGYTDIIYQQVEMGYGLEIRLGKNRLIIGLPFDYPKKAPTVVQINGQSYRQIEFENNWDPFLTIGHIVNAIAEGAKDNV